MRDAAGRDVNLYWWGQATSAFGSVFTAIAMPVVAVIYLRATPAELGLVSAASIFPALVLGLPAGALADRIKRPRRTLIGLDTISAIAVGGVALGLNRHVASIGWLIALSLVEGTVAILSEIVYFIHLRQVVGADRIGRARARLQAGQYGAGFAGRLLVGPTIVAFGGAAAMAIDAVSYVLSAAALLAMAPVAAIAREKTELTLGRTLRSMVAGMRFFMGGAFHRALLVFIVVPIATAAGVSALTAPFLLHTAHIPTGVYGMLFAVSGLMGLIGSAVAGRMLRPGRDPRRLTLAAFSASTACTVLLPLASGSWPVAAACAAFGIGLPIFFGAIANVALSPVIVADVDESSMGRTVAMLQFTAAAAGLVGALAGGAIGEWIGLRPAVWALDGTALVAVALALPQAIRAVRPTERGDVPATLAEIAN